MVVVASKNRAGVGEEIDWNVESPWWPGRTADGCEELIIADSESQLFDGASVSLRLSRAVSYSGGAS